MDLPTNHPLVEDGLEALRDELRSETEQDYLDSPDSLYNDKLHATRLIREKPEHRMAVLLKAQGKSNIEIAAIMDKTPVWVGYTLRQPWARRRLLDEIQNEGRDAVQELLRGAVADSVLTLIEVRDTGKPSEKVVAANSILDRYFGKPTQRVETDNVHTHATLDELNRQIASLEEEERSLSGASRN